LSEPALNDDFRDMIASLLAAGVEFLVVGAHALAAHGIPRATGDIDLFVRADAANAARVIRALRSFGAPIDQHGVAVADFERLGTVYQIGLPPRRIDLLTEISGVSFDSAWASKIAVTVGDLTFFVIGRDALLENKRATGRDKDLIDVRALEDSGT
jgi:hypothetical protein